MTLEQKLIDKVNSDYDAFKADTLHQEPSAVYELAYKIHYMTEIKEVLLTNASKLAEDMSPSAFECHVDSDYSLLEHLYDEWLHTEDNFYTELTEAIMNMLM